MKYVHLSAVFYPCIKVQTDELDLCHVEWFSSRAENVSCMCDSMHRCTGMQERRSRDTGSTVSHDKASNL